MKLKARVLVVEDTYLEPSSKLRVVVGEVINETISADGCFALSDPDRDEPKMISLQEIKKDGKRRLMARVGEMVHLTIVGGPTDIKKGMVISKRKWGILDVIALILRHLP